MTSPRRPGAYYQRVDRARPGPATIRSDIAALVGIARQGPLDTPAPVESFRQFQSQFGGFTGVGYLAYAVKAFFENGGARVWIVRVASRRDDLGARASALEIGPPGAGWRLAASSPGTWGDELAVRVRRERRVETALDVGASTEIALAAGTVAGLQRFDLVEVAQPGLPSRTAVVAAVDPTGRRALLTGDADFPYPWQRIALDRSRPATLASVSYALDVYREGRLVDHVVGLSQIPRHPRYAPTFLALPDYDQAIRLGRPAGVAPLVIVEDLAPAGAVAPAPFDLTAGGRLQLVGGRDGLAVLVVDDFTGEDFEPHDDDGAAAAKLRGVRALELVDEISIVAVPDIVIHPDPDPVVQPEPLPPVDPCLRCPPPPELRRAVGPRRSAGELPPVFSDAEVFRVQSALVAHCEALGDRFAVLDPPFSASRNDAVGLGAIVAWRQRFDTAYAALYYPWVRAFEPRGVDVLRDIPPSGHVVGQYARHDLQNGVHRAPANARLGWLQDLTAHSGFGGEEQLNDLSINALRAEAARGMRIMGARTLSSDSDARFVNVRRLILLIKRAVRLLSQWVVFEPNSAATRAKYAAVLENFLAGLHERGAFAGATPEASFFVRCGEENNPAADRDEGRLLAEIGVAPAHPLEFIVMRVGLQGNELTIDDASALARAA